MNETIKKILVGLGIMLAMVLLWIVWYFNIFGLAGNIELEVENISEPQQNKPLTKQEQKDILDNLAPTKALTESEKNEKINILENLQKQQAVPNTSAVDLLNSLSGNISEEEQLKLLESL